MFYGIFCSAQSLQVFIHADIFLVRLKRLHKKASDLASVRVGRVTNPLRVTSTWYQLLLPATLDGYVTALPTRFTADVLLRLQDEEHQRQQLEDAEVDIKLEDARRLIMDYMVRSKRTFIKVPLILAAPRGGSRPPQINRLTRTHTVRPMKSLYLCLGFCFCRFTSTSVCCCLRGVPRHAYTKYVIVQY